MSNAMYNSVLPIRSSVLENIENAKNYRAQEDGLSLPFF